VIKIKNERPLEELIKVGVVLAMAGIIGLALLVYLFYVLFKGEEL